MFELCDRIPNYWRTSASQACRTQLQKLSLDLVVVHAHLRRTGRVLAVNIQLAATVQANGYPVRPCCRIVSIQPRVVTHLYALT